MFRVDPSLWRAFGPKGRHKPAPGSHCLWLGFGPPLKLETNVTALSRRCPKGAQKQQPKNNTIHCQRNNTSSQVPLNNHAAPEFSQGWLRKGFRGAFCWLPLAIATECTKQSSCYSDKNSNCHAFSKACKSYFGRCWVSV